MKKPNKKFNLEQKISVLVTLIFVVILSCMTLGFALYSKNLTIGGNAIAKKIGRVEITRIDYITGSNVQGYAQHPEFDGLNADFNMTFKKTGNSDEFYITYEVEVYNGYYRDYIFRGFDFNPKITATNNKHTANLDLELDGVSNGDVLHPGESKIFRVKFILDPSNTNGTYTTEVESEVNTTPQTQDEGALRASITPNTCDLTGDNTRCTFTLSVVNTFSYDREFSLISSNSNFKFFDGAESNNALSPLTIPANSSHDYTIYIGEGNNVIFLSETATSTILLSSNGIANVSAGNVEFNVDVYEGVDDEKVVVSNAKLDWVRTNNKRDTKKIIATWDRDDEGGSDVVNYKVLLYKTSDTQTAYKECDTNSAVQSCTFEDVADDTTYYIIVYGEDRAENSGVDYVSRATTNPGYATKSPEMSFKWGYEVTFSLSHLSKTSGTTSTAYIDQDYTASLQVSGWGYELPSSSTYKNRISIKMNGVTLTPETDFTYDANYGRINIPNVTGKIEITATADGNGWCLAEGTKVLLANGTYKNIENINYDDLLLVYSYETGKFVEEYPIWIEKEHQSKYYQVTTFSDGSTLNTVGGHGVYNYDLNSFVSVNNDEEFDIGSTIAKINKNKDGFDKVTVKSINYVYEEINYYHVVSTRYYNIIADDFLTTDDAVVLSNLYGFNDNITWPKEIRDEAIKDVYNYDDLKDAIPYYMFKGLRAEEGKILANYGLDLEIFKTYLINNQNNPDLLKLPMQKFGKNIWMVTTSEDNVTNLNKSNYLMPEGSIYTLPKSKKKNFIGWLNTTDNKMYMPGDKATVYGGTYFKAIYK